MAAAAAARTIANAKIGGRIAFSVDAKFEYKEKQSFEINKNEIRQVWSCPEQTIVNTKSNLPESIIANCGG